MGIHFSSQSLAPPQSRTLISQKPDLLQDSTEHLALNYLQCKTLTINSQKNRADECVIGLKVKEF